MGTLPVLREKKKKQHFMTGDEELEGEKSCKQTLLNSCLSSLLLFTIYYSRLKLLCLANSSEMYYFFV